MYQNLRTQIIENAKNEIAEFNQNIENKTANDILNSGICNYTTPKHLEILKTLDPHAIPDKKITDKIKQKHEREILKKQNKYIDEIAKVENAPNTKLIMITVEFKRSKTWGWNPTATIGTESYRTDATARGWGYEKESAAIAEAINANPEALKAIYQALNEGQTIPHITTKLGPAWVPGARGLSIIKDIYTSLGWSWYSSNGKNINIYTIVKE